MGVVAKPSETRYTTGMESTVPLLPPEIWEATPAESQAVIVALQERVPELEARLGQDSSNSSRPPSSDPPQSPAKGKRQADPSEAACRCTVAALWSAADGGRGDALREVPAEPTGNVPGPEGLVGRHGVAGAVINLESAQSAALGPTYAEVREAVQKADVAYLDETGWRED